VRGYAAALVQRALPHAAAVLPFLCAWCDRVRTTDGEWEAVDDALLGMEATHGICPDCLDVETRAVCGPVAWR
jgi:hypothetical protein